MVIVSSGAHRWANAKGQGAAGGLASGAGVASQGAAAKAAAGQGWGTGKWKAYAGSKLCGVLYAAELTKRYGGEGSGVVGVAVRPGTVATSIARHSLLLRLLFSVTQPFLTSVEEVGGAREGIYGAGATSCVVFFSWRHRRVESLLPARHPPFSFQVSAC